MGGVTENVILQWFPVALKIFLSLLVLDFFNVQKLLQTIEQALLKLVEQTLLYTLLNSHTDLNVFHSLNFQCVAISLQTTKICFAVMEIFKDLRVAMLSPQELLVYLYPIVEYYNTALVKSVARQPVLENRQNVLFSAFKTRGSACKRATRKCGA